MTAEELYDKLLDKAEEFGMVPQNGEKDASNPKGNAIVRKNIKGHKRTIITLIFQLFEH